MDNVYHVEFEYNNEPKSSLMKKIYENEFIRVRNKACNILDSYEEWNEEFNRTYPKGDKSGIEDPRYVKFICKKSNKVLEQLDNASPFVIIRASVAREGDLVAISKVDWKTVICINLKES